MAAPGFYYFFVGPALAAVLMLVINAFAIVFSSPAKQFLAIGRMRRGELQRRIPSRRYRRREGEEECSVCLSAFVDGQRVRPLLHCGHGFHASCIDKWLMSHATCPICRADVLSPPPAIANRAVGCGV